MNARLLATLLLFSLLFGWLALAMEGEWTEIQDEAHLVLSMERN